MAEKLPLLSDSSESDVEFKINKSYADKYDTWRNNEEMQKLKAMSKDEDLDSSSSESEEEEVPEIEVDFLKTLSLLKSKDPKIYDESVTFFKDEPLEKKIKAKKPKPVYMKDYERKLVLERNGEFSDEEHIPSIGPTYSEEQEELKKNFKAALESSDEEGEAEGGLFQVREKKKSEEDAEEAKYLQWLKMQKNEVEEDTDKAMSFLQKFWNDPKLDEDEKFLKDYILNKKYIEKEKSDFIPTYDEITNDIAMLNEDEKIVNEQDVFEHKYNFRFEEPDPEFVKRYPRTIGDSLRRVDNRRKMKREEYTERKKKEKEQKREELKRLKALKRKEIEDKFFKLKEVSGREDLNLDEDDIESDFDPDKHDKKMNELFNDDYYKVEEQQKPVFSYDDELDDENWDNWVGKQNDSDDEDDRSEKQNPKSENSFKIDPKLQFEREMIESTHTGRKKMRKKSLFATTVAKPKPLFDPNGKSFEEYLDEYYKLDYEDLVGDMPVRFKYRKVVPNDFGLSIDEILTAHDKELNRWCSVKKTCQYRQEDEELYDVQAFQKKAQNMLVKQKVLASVYLKPENESTKPDVADGAKPKKRKSKKKVQETENPSPNIVINNLEDNAKPVIESQSVADDEKLHKSKKMKVVENMQDASSTSVFENSTLSELNLTNSEYVAKRKRSKKKKTGEKQTTLPEFVTDGEEHVRSVELYTLGERNTSPHSVKKDDASNSKKRRKSKDKLQSKLNLSSSQGNKVDNILPSGELSNMQQLLSCNTSDGKAETSEETLVFSSKKKKKKNSNGISDPDSCNALNSTLNETKISANSEGQNSLKSSKRKRKRKKNKKFATLPDNSSTTGDIIQEHFPSNGKKHFKNSVADKRLALSNERLAAYGINPKKFKNSILYSQK